MKCQQCNFDNPEGSLFCCSCGSKLIPPKPLCPKCNNEQLFDDPKFCPFCGYHFGGEASMIGDKNVIAGDVTQTINNSSSVITDGDVSFDVSKGASIGDKNVISGDVIQNITNTIVHMDDSKTVLSCVCCGRLLEKGSGLLHLCSKCGKPLCLDCYDPKTKICPSCKEEEKTKKAEVVASEDEALREEAYYEFRKNISRLGASVPIGFYPSESDGRKKPIYWRVLAIEEGHALVFCENIIDAKRFDGASADYEHSEIRHWLNNEFIQTAFMPREIVYLDAYRSSNQLGSLFEYSMMGMEDILCRNAKLCQDTVDRVFLLSIRDVTNPKYNFSKTGKPDNNRCKGPTPYAVSKGISKASPTYWLRSSDPKQTRLGFIDRDGQWSCTADPKDEFIGVAPAMWVII